MSIVLDIILICLIALFGFLGASKGFARTLIEVVGYILVVFLSLNISSFVADYTYQNYIKQPIVETVSEKTDEKLEQSNASIEEKVDVIFESIPAPITAISGIEKDDISDFLNDYSTESVEKTEKISADICDGIVKPIIVPVIELLLSIILIIVLVILVKLIAKLVGNFFNKSVFKGVNKFLGVIAGAIKGIIISLLVVALFSIVFNICDNKLFYVTPEIIDKTYLFKVFYNISAFL